jgi:hypothetical protein
MANFHSYASPEIGPGQALFLDSLPTEPPPVVENHSEKVAQSEPGSLTRSGKILHPAAIERYCRRSIELHPKKNCSEIRLAIEASVLHGNEWFIGLPIFRLVSGQADPCISESSRKMLEELGIAECKLDKGQYILRLLGEMVDIDHHHGRRAAALRRNIEIHYKTRTRATPLAALLLLGIDVQQINSFRRLHEFVGPDAYSGDRDQ